MERQFRALQEIEKEFPDKLKRMNEKFDASQKELQAASGKIDVLERIKGEVKRILDKTRVNAEQLDSTLSCLSCLEYLVDPLTLNCGHSICRKCFETHSDPKSKDSLVFCEECKIETKNKLLKEQLVMRTICDKYGVQREAFQSLTGLVNK